MSESDKNKEHNHKVHKCPTEGENYENPQIILLSKETTDIIKKEIKLTKDSIIFDFGAGTGLLGLEFINQVKHVIFEDVSKVMLDYLQYKCETKGIKNYTIFNGIIEDYKSQEKVDLITAGMVVHHVEDLKSLFSKFLEILKPGGYVCIVDLYKDAPMFSIGGHKHHHVMPHKGFIPEDLCEELKKAGFVNTEIKEVSSINFKGADGKDIISKRFMIIAQGP
jgi:2-polyprenyl-3-methyl-5-hydroxy-6-metoxy-1,4-benzoquinol methylase